MPLLEVDAVGEGLDQARLPRRSKILVVDDDEQVRTIVGWQLESTVTEHVHRLRQKIERDSTRPRRLRTRAQYRIPIRASAKAMTDYRPHPRDIAIVGVGVADERPGFAGRSRRRQIFPPFDRLGAERAPVHGVGLGMPLSRALVEARGGSLRLAGRPDFGTVVETELPRR